MCREDTEAMNDEDRQAWFRNMWEGKRDEPQPPIDGAPPVDHDDEEEDDDDVGDDFEAFVEEGGDDDFGDFDEADETPMPEPQPSTAPSEPTTFGSLVGTSFVRPSSQYADLPC